MGWFDEQIRQREKSDQSILEDSFFRMAGVVMDKWDTERMEDGHLIAREALDDILKYYHQKAPEIPENIRNADEQLAFAIRPAGLMTREVELDGNWQSDAYGPMLGYMKDSRAMVALLPGTLSGYYFRDPATGRKTRVTRETAKRFAREALEERDPLSLVNEQLIPALDRVGADYEQGRAFLPQLLSAAQAAQAAFEEVRAVLAVKGGETVSKGRIIVATVQGDIHDIGKNIVKTVLQNYGYEVMDLGRDVPPETIVNAAREGNIPLVGLSALMTTTLPAMEETVRRLRRLERPPFVMVGGAVVTPEYARAMGADAYARDAREAAEIAKKVFGQ